MSSPIPESKRPAVDRALNAAFGTSELDSVVPLTGGLSGALVYRIRVGGIARRFGWNSTLLRALYVILSIASAAFPGVVVYLILWLLMPEGD